MRFLAVVVVAAAHAGCAGTLAPELAAATAVAPPPADLDSIM